MRKGALERSLLAWAITRRAMVSQHWMADRLKMGVAANVGKYVKVAAESAESRVLNLRLKLESI